jgi:Concanavalin A-like lectin/glucanases superfamily
MGTYDSLILSETGISAYFAMEDASGHLVDSVAGNNTTVETALTYGRPGPGEGLPSVGFNDNSTSKATAPSNAAFNFGDGPLTVEVWCKRNATGSLSSIVDRGSTTGDSWILFFQAANTVRFNDSGFTSTNMLVSSTTVTDTVSWHHIVATKTGATRHLYIDGVDVSVSGTNVTLGNSTSVLTIGPAGPNPTDIARLALYSVVLTPAQVSNHFSVGTLQPPFYIPSFRSPFVGPRHRAGLLPIGRTPRFFGIGGAGPVANQQALNAGLSFVGAMPRAITSGKTGSLSFVGALPRAITKTLASASLSFSGALKRATGKTLGSASLSFSGALPRAIGTHLAAGLTFVGAMPRAIHTGLAGGLSFVGAQKRAITKSLSSASLSFSGALPRAIGTHLSGALSFSGSLTRIPGKLLAGALSFSGSLPRSIGTHFAGSLSFSGALKRAMTTGLNGSLSFSGNLKRAVTKTLTGASLSFSGSLTSSRTYLRTLAASLSFSGALPRSIGKITGAGLSFSGALPRAIRTGLAGSLSFVGAQKRAVTKSLTAASLSFSGSLVHGQQFVRTLTASLSFSGSLPRQIGKALAGALSFSGLLNAVKGGAGTFSGGPGPAIGQAISGIAAAIANAINPGGRGDSSGPGGSGTSSTPGGSASSNKPGS